MARRVSVLTLERRIASLGAFLARVVGVRRRAKRVAQKTLRSCIFVDAGVLSWVLLSCQLRQFLRLYHNSPYMFIEGMLKMLMTGGEEKDGDVFQLEPHSLASSYHYLFPLTAFQGSWILPCSLTASILRPRSFTIHSRCAKESLLFSSRRTR